MLRRWLFNAINLEFLRALDIYRRRRRSGRRRRSALSRLRCDGVGADADIYQRDANGNIELDNVGRKKIAKAKVRPAFRSIVAAKVQEWAEAGDIGELGAIQSQVIINQVKQQAKPVVQ